MKLYEELEAASKSGRYNETVLAIDRYDVYQLRNILVQLDGGDVSMSKFQQLVRIQ